MQSKAPAYGETDNARQIRAYSANETWPEDLACCHKRIYINACAARDCFSLTSLSPKTIPPPAVLRALL